MRKLWTSGFCIQQNIDGLSQKIRVSIEHLDSEIPKINGDHDIWVHESEIESLQSQLKQKDEEIEKVIWILGDYLAGYNPNLKAKKWLEKNKGN